MVSRPMMAAATILLAAGCGTLPIAPGIEGKPDTAEIMATRNAAKASPASPVTEDLSFLDVASYLKVARLYATWTLFLRGADLDYAGCRWLDGNGLVLEGTAGWTFGFYHRPENGQSGIGYAVIHVDQKHAASTGKETEILHRGVGGLYLGGMPSPRRSIQAALAQGLPRGDRYGVEYLSASELAPAVSVVTSFRGDRSQGFKAIRPQK